MMRSALCTCLLLVSGLQTATAWFWPFKTESPAAFNHDNVTALTTDTFESKVQQ